MFEKELNRKAEESERILRDYFPNEQYPQEIYRSASYSLFAGGKRIRPILIMEACRLCGGSVADCAPLAAAMEMIHTYSLIHDDLPCMDDDDLRRGKPTNHIMFGEAVAVLAGDALLNLAYETILKGYFSSASKASYMTGARIIAQAAGMDGMIGGQTSDILNEGKEPDPELLEYIHSHKTGALIKASVLAGAAAAGAGSDAMSALEVYGNIIGLMFQISDDILDVVGHESELGKKTNADAQHSKMTYPYVYGMEASYRKAHELYANAGAALNRFGESASFLIDLAKYLYKRNK